MDSKINYSWISSYSEEYCEKIVNDYFSYNSKIDGKGILNLTDIPQINLFTIKLLFQQWKEEINRLKSPFFDYQTGEVKQAMRDFMNVLSRNISIDKGNFSTLFKMAVEDTILLIFSPYDYYKKEISRKSRIHLSELREVSKYIKINENLMVELIRKIESKGNDFVTIEEGYRLLHDILENTHETPEDFEPYRKKFSYVKPLAVDNLYMTDQSYSNNPVPTNNENQPPAIQHTEDKDVEISELPMLNDKFRKEDKNTLAGIHQHKKVENIRHRITLNQRFMFVKELFNSDPDSFTEAIDHIDHTQTYDEALNYLQQNYVHQNKWDMESEEVAEFLEVISKKYG